ncbi:hypothetical protein KFU94_35885 [Chloroflexi bacterium TSY]|nr:hypothetical protein [Chloroflexi bacterium TSY]
MSKASGLARSVRRVSRFIDVLPSLRRRYFSVCDTASRVSSCYPVGPDVTWCSATSTLPERASLATAGCEASGTM